MERYCGDNSAFHKLTASIGMIIVCGVKQKSSMSSLLRKSRILSCILMGNEDDITVTAAGKKKPDSGFA
jgi:hypothetical protein